MNQHTVNLVLALSITLIAFVIAQKPSLELPEPQLGATTFFTTLNTGTSTLPGVLNVTQAGSTSTFSGGFTAKYFNQTGTAATSTFARGIDLAGGCFSISGTCITLASISGTIDISSQTNLTAGDHITLTNDDLDVDDDFILNTGDTGTGAYTFPYASSTAITVTGQIDFDSLTSAIILTGAGGILAEYAGTSGTNQFLTALDALGAGTFASVVSEYLGDDDWGDITIASGAASVEDDSHAHTGTSISGLTNADLDGAAGITAANLALTFGRSLTISTNDVAADSELYTSSFTFNYASSSLATSTQPVLTKLVPQAATVTSVTCWAQEGDAATSSISFEERTAPWTAGTDVLQDPRGVAAGSQAVTASSTLANASLASGSYLAMIVEGYLLGTPNAPFCDVKFTWDD